MVKIAIVDDDRQDADTLERMISRYCEETVSTDGGGESVKNIVVETYSDGIAFLNEFPTANIDVVFMDIEMPQLNGMETAKRLREISGDVAIVFVTNMAQYAIDGYEVNATDFIVKPVTYGDFALKFKKVLRYLSRIAGKSLLLRLSESDSVRIDCLDIYYVEVVQHYLIFHTKKGEYKVRGTMTNTESILSAYSFVRCSKSFLVNLKHVVSVRGYRIGLRDGSELYASRSMKEGFLNEYCKYLGGIR